MHSFNQVVFWFTIYFSVITYVAAYIISFGVSNVYSNLLCLLKISFAAVLVLSVSFFAFLSVLILEMLSLSSIFVNLIWSIFLNTSSFSSLFLHQAYRFFCHNILFSQEGSCFIDFIYYIDLVSLSDLLHCIFNLLWCYAFRSKCCICRISFF